MHTPFTSKHFTRYTDPVSGQTMAILQTKFAPVQKNLYFVNPCYSNDGRYLWFSCVFPSNGSGMAAVLDFLEDEIHIFPDTAQSCGHLVEKETGNLYYANAKGLYYRTPDPWKGSVLISETPEELKKVGSSYGPSHLSFTPDKKELIVDLRTPEGSQLGSVDIATGKYTPWYFTDAETVYDHAQCCPTNGDLMMCAHELWDEKLRRNKPVFIDGIYPRLQLITRDGQRTMLKPYGNGATHEWWAPDGKSVYYVNNDVQDSGVGVVARNWLDGRETEVICSCSTPGAFNHLWHAQCTQDQNYFVMDAAYPCMGERIWRGAESMVYFHNHITNKTIKFLTKNPVVEGWSPQRPCWYHIDPHPSFILNDQFVIFTTTVLGHVDIAFASVADLIEATK